jgi:hypothetical protein
MTFYNIIFGILFLNACQAVLASIGASAAGPWYLAADPWFLAFVALLIFNDAVNTSEVIEERKVEYKIQMKLFDLVSFLLLSMAIISISRSTQVFGDANAFARLWPFFREPLAPSLLLLGYCVSVALWIFYAEELRTRDEWRWYLWVAVVMIVGAIIATGVIRANGLHVSAPWLHTLATGVGIVGAFIYLISYWIIGKAKARTGSQSAVDEAKAKVDQAVQATEGSAKAAAASARAANQSAGTAGEDAKRAERAATRAESAAGSMEKKPPGAAGQVQGPAPA